MKYRSDYFEIKMDQTYYNLMNPFQPISTHLTGITLERRVDKSHPDVRLHDLDFADDIALLSSSIESAEILLQHIEVSNCVGRSLHLNVGKTKTLLVNIPSSTKVKSLSGAELENIKEFIYLGSLLSACLPHNFLDSK